MATVFKVGDHAFHKSHGVARVTAIETKEIMGHSKTFYCLVTLENNMKILIPADSVETSGLREIISKGEVQEVIKLLRKTDVKADNQTWNRRYREYMEKIKTGSVYEIAEVLRDLFLLKVEKEQLSFGEGQMLEKARGRLLKELTLAASTDELSKEPEVKAILGL